MSQKTLVKTGDLYGKLSILRELSVMVHPSGRTRRLFECQCECGKIISATMDNLRSKNHTTSCGCVGAAARLRSITTHGQHGSPAYRSWRAMLQRCLDKNTPIFKQYGARGITVCERWFLFENFLEDMGRRPHGTSLDRIENSKGYTPGNCRWATYKTQVLNRSMTKYVDYNGEKLCQSDWSRRLGGGIDLVMHRIRRGWSPEKAVSTPLVKRNLYA